LVESLSKKQSVKHADGFRSYGRNDVGNDFVA